MSREQQNRVYGSGNMVGRVARTRSGLLSPNGDVRYLEAPSGVKVFVRGARYA